MKYRKNTQRTVEVFLIIINRVSCVLTIILGMISMVSEIFGVPALEKLLCDLHIPLSVNAIIIIGCICAAIWIVSCVLREKYKL